MQIIKANNKKSNLNKKYSYRSLLRHVHVHFVYVQKLHKCGRCFIGEFIRNLLSKLSS